MAARKSPSDWDAIESEYCSSVDSIREIADRHSISEGAIRKRAKAERWERPVRKPRKREELRTSAPTPPAADPDAPVDAATIAEGGRGLVHRMLDELDVVTSRRGELEEMIADATDGDDDDARQKSMERAISLPSRARVLKELAAAFKTLNEAAAPQGKKAAQQDRADQIANRFRGVGPPTLKAVK